MSIQTMLGKEIVNSINNGSYRLPVEEYKPHSIRFMVGQGSAHNAPVQRINEPFNEIDNKFRRNEDLNERIKIHMLQGEPWSWAVHNAKNEVDMTRPALWNKDNEPKKPLNSESSFISGAEVKPNNTITLFFKGKPYTYRGGFNAEETVKNLRDLLVSQSLGREINGQWGLLNRF